MSIHEAEYWQDYQLDKGPTAVESVHEPSHASHYFAVLMFSKLVFNAP